MKKLLSITILICFFISNAQNSKSDKKAIKTIIGEIDKRDLNCLSEIKKAKIDFKYKETFYDIDYEGCISIKANRYYPFLIKLLQEKNINFAKSQETEIDSFWYEDKQGLYQVITNCYYKASNELLNLKYGKNFIKDIERKADSLYVISKLNNVFDYPYDVDDYCIVYPKAQDFLDQKKEIVKDFFTDFKFPSNFIRNDKERSFLAKTNFIIKRDSKISDISIEIEFTNSENQKFKEYIFNELKEFIENANWRAAVSSGVKVDCRFNVNFYN